jgi:hypothetical protein
MKEQVLSQVNTSGFPFQLKLESLIRETQSKHHWMVADREHAWKGSEDRFIDLVLRSRDVHTFRIVVESKRVRATDSRQLRWIFLLPDLGAQPTLKASCFEIEAYSNENDHWTEIAVWDNQISLAPASIQSEFCILQGEDKNKPLLEKTARSVIDAVEGLAMEEIKMEKSVGPHHLRRFIFPAIVTNAELAICQFDPGKVSVKDGTLNFDDFELSVVPCVRFRKSFTSDFPTSGKFYELDAVSRAREQTILIINGENLPDVLTQWDLGNDSYLAQRIRRGY